MTVAKPRLRVSAPTGPAPSGRGFYQLEEESLYVQIGSFNEQHSFFSWLESDTVRFDIDKKGRLVFIEVDLPRRHWPKADSIPMPVGATSGDIRFLDFRSRLSTPQITTSHMCRRMLLEFASETNSRFIYLANSVIAGLDDMDRLVSVLIDDICDDLAGQEISAFRKSLTA
ncbi:MAG: hypothetical protein ACE5FH_11195 [Candidatus Zixiibacteriota bacterium]